MQNSPKSPESLSIGVLLFDQFSNHCLANAIEPLRAANTLSRRSLYDWQFLTVDGSVATSSSGLPVMPDGPLAAHPGGQYLFVLPSYGHLDHVTPANMRALRAAAGRFDVVVGMDTGAWLMAEAGLLNGRAATIHWDELTNLAEAFVDVDVREDRFVIDGNRITCGGVTTTFDLILHLIQQRHGPMLRMEIAALFMHGERSHLSDPQVRATSIQQVDAAVAVMRRNIEYPLTIAEVAARVGVSQKKLEHLFRAALGDPPQTIYKKLRLSEARRQVEQTRFRIAEIASRCGYADASGLTRAFTQEFGYAPSVLRREPSLD